MTNCVSIPERVGTMRLMGRLSLALLLTCVPLLTTELRAAEEMTATPKARQHFAAGLAHVDDPTGPKYEEAYREFHAAYAETPSYEIAVNIGTCAFYLERDAEAIEMYELYLAKATASDISPKKRELMMKDVQALRAGLVRVSIRTSPSNGTIVDQRFTSKGTTVVNRYAVSNGVAILGIHPGNHKLTFEAEGQIAEDWVLDASPASSHAHEFKLSRQKKPEVDAASPNAAASGSEAYRVEPRQPATSPWVYVGLAATGTFALAAIGTGLVANSKKNDFDSANDGSQSEQARKLRDETTRYLLVSDVFSGAALLSAGATVYLYLSQSKGDDKSGPKAKAWRLTPQFGKSYGGLEMLGHF